MHLHILHLLCCLVTLHLSYGRVYLRESFLTEKSLRSWVMPVEPDDLGIFQYGGRMDRFSEFEGISTLDTFKYYRMSRKSAPFANRNKTLVLQYEVGYPKSYECGGGYLKLLNVGYDARHFSEKSPYTVRFGADVCKFERKIVLELSGQGKVHKWKKSETFSEDEGRHLLTLLLFPNDTYQVKLDLETIAGGRLVEDFAEYPPEFIYNESIAKPADWDDRELVVDTSDKQPTYWEDEFIPDQDLDLPSTDWLNSEVWNIPTVPNLHRNSIWKPRMLRNPYYDGPWLGQRMKNPEFSTSLHDLGVIGAVAIDIWQPYAGVVFDNILLTDDEKYAENFAASTWVVYQRVMRSYKYKRDLIQYSMRMKSSVLARTKLDPRDDLSDEDMEYLRSKYHRSRLNDLEGERQAVKSLRQKRYTSLNADSQWQMAKREALEAFLDLDACYAFEAKLNLWKQKLLPQIYGMCPLKRRTRLRKPLRR
nr:unnamed protein product [Spirometra erinaceieuropaei]